MLVSYKVIRKFSLFFPVFWKNLCDIAINTFSYVWKNLSVKPFGPGVFFLENILNIYSIPFINMWRVKKNLICAFWTLFHPLSDFLFH